MIGVSPARYCEKGSLR